MEELTISPTTTEEYNPLGTAIAAPESEGNPLPEASTEAPEESTFDGVDFEAFADRKEGVEPEATEPEVTETPEETPAQPERKVLAPNGKKPIVLQKDRDFTGIDDADKPLFRDMSKESFNKLKEIYVASKKKDEQIAALQKAPQQQFIHPEAYRLDAEYQKMEEVTGILSSVESHYIAQLEKIAQGEKWNDLGVDEKGNPFIQGQSQEPDVRSEQYIRKMLAQTQNEMLGTQRRMSEMSTGYVKNYQNDLNVIKTAEEKYFPGYDKPDHETQKLQSTFINEVLPPTFRSHPLAKTLAKTVANNALFKRDLEAAEKKVKELEARLAGKPTAQPTKANLRPGNAKVADGKNPFEDVDYDAFKMRLAGV